MNELTDEEIGGYYDRTHAEILKDIPEEYQRKMREGYTQAVRNSPEALRQLRKTLNR